MHEGYAVNLNSIMLNVMHECPCRHFCYARCRKSEQHHVKCYALSYARARLCKDRTSDELAAGHANPHSQGRAQLLETKRIKQNSRKVRTNAVKQREHGTRTRIASDIVADLLRGDGPEASCVQQAEQLRLDLSERSDGGRNIVRGPGGRRATPCYRPPPSQRRPV